MFNHVLIRTNPKGQTGVFRCRKCGRYGLSINDLWTCRVKGQPEQDVVDAINGPGGRKW